VNGRYQNAGVSHTADDEGDFAGMIKWKSVSIEIENRSVANLKDNSTVYLNLKFSVCYWTQRPQYCAHSDNTALVCTHRRSQRGA